ncbi:glycosyltransferase [Exiguobacterium sp. SL-10]|uniref:glycosyltransferase family 2 protein n=1 Tax=Exiguobacterium sp. SL-10 TaxID=2510962 RepID=UPI00103CCA34|nr:glycosyltransferase [Exiguobacterium sp. SL-10]TCI30401.1 glycosyltransferase [Exiguobacterium sp. SL-10]
MERPLVSIVIPVYNGADYLKETIESALAQTYERIEVLVINDGSTDGGATAEIARSFGSRIRYYEKPNGGVSTALNLGIDKMRGEWFSWLSHDDLYEPEKVNDQVEELLKLGDQAERYILSCGTTLIDEAGAPIHRPRRQLKGVYTNEAMFDYLLLKACLSGCALLIPKRALEQVGGFPTTYRYIQDWVCWVDLALSGYQFKVTTAPHSKTRIHAKQQTKKIADLAPIETARFFEQLFVRLDTTNSVTTPQIKTVFKAVYRSTDPEVREDLLQRFDGPRHLSRMEQQRLNVSAAIYQRLLTFYRGMMNLRYR